MTLCERVSVEVTQVTTDQVKQATKTRDGQDLLLLPPRSLSLSFGQQIETIRAKKCSEVNLKNMAKSSKWTKYGKKYNQAWEKDPELKDWIRSVAGDDTKAACKFCRTTHRAHRNDLLQHRNTEKHKRNAAPFSGVRTLFETGIINRNADHSVKALELKLATQIACHSSIKVIDHLGEIVKEASAKDISLHRTKCTALINKVLGPVMLKELCKDIGENEYSLIIDESTDIATQKQLCVVVRYPSFEKKKIVTSFLGLIKVANGTAEAVTSALLDFLKNDVKLDVSKCTGLGTDGCNVMCGQHNSVISRFREINPHVTHIKCICHSLQLCASYAMQTLPRNLEYMVEETYNYFRLSSIRQAKYAQLYSTINIGEHPLKILQLSETRWLAIAPCVTRILEQYIELKLHFQVSHKCILYYSIYISLCIQYTCIYVQGVPKIHTPLKILIYMFSIV